MFVHSSINEQLYFHFNRILVTESPQKIDTIEFGTSSPMGFIGNFN
jgi:hypothetical protein